MSDAAGTPRAAAIPPPPNPGIPALFGQFAGIGLLGFGGVLPLTRLMLVEQQRWLTATEFTDLLALCQFLPGGNVINLTAAVGLRYRGLAGACATLAGLMLGPMCVVMLLGLVYARYQQEPLVRRLFAGMAAAAAGLVVATSLKIASPLLRNPIGIGVALLAFAAIAILRLPLLPTMLTLAPLSILLAWLRRA